MVDTGRLEPSTSCVYQQNGKLDTQVFYQLSDSAIPEIATLKGDARYGSEIEKILDGRKSRLNSTNWQNFSFAWAAARQAVNSKD
jgi:hypothetical protein